MEVDIPLDPGGVGSLLLTKSASKNEVQIGEFVLYTLQLSNPAGGPPLTGLTLDAISCPPASATKAGPSR